MTERKKSSGRGKMPERYRVWVDAENKLASFHKVEGSFEMNFSTEEQFQSYVDELVSHSYRFL